MWERYSKKLCEDILRKTERDIAKKCGGYSKNVWKGYSKKCGRDIVKNCERI